MTSNDVRIVFRNISAIASFSSQFAKRLETAFDCPSKDGDSAEDKVGELFLEIVCRTVDCVIHSLIVLRILRTAPGP